MSNGQVTSVQKPSPYARTFVSFPIPQQLREQMGLHPLMESAFEVAPDADTAVEMAQYISENAGINPEAIDVYAGYLN